MRLYALIIMATFGFFGVSSNSEASTEPNIKICNNCDSDMFWKENAKSSGVGVHEIYNLESGEVRTYAVQEIESRFDPSSTMLAAVLIGNSQEATDNLTAALNMKYEIEAFVNAVNGTSQPYSLLSPPIVNGCGRPDHFSQHAPDWWELEDACNQHDACYASGRGFQECNDEFEMLLDTYVFEYFIHATADWGMAAALKHALYSALANGYVAAVNHSSVFNHFCSLDANENSVECQANEPGHIPAGAVFTGHGVETTATTGTGHTIIATCELWQFPDGNGGHYIIERNCEFDIYWMKP